VRATTARTPRGADLIDFPTTCDCRETGHALQDDIAQDQADDRILGAYYEERL
jgi:hypothetical protein